MPTTCVETTRAPGIGRPPGSAGTWILPAGFAALVAHRVAREVLQRRTHRLASQIDRRTLDRHPRLGRRIEPEDDVVLELVRRDTRAIRGQADWCLKAVLLCRRDLELAA